MYLVLEDRFWLITVGREFRFAGYILDFFGIFRLFRHHFMSGLFEIELLSIKDVDYELFYFHVLARVLGGEESGCNLEQGLKGRERPHL